MGDWRDSYHPLAVIRGGNCAYAVIYDGSSKADDQYPYLVKSKYDPLARRYTVYVYRHLKPIYIKVVVLSNALHRHIL